MFVLLFVAGATPKLPLQQTNKSGVCPLQQVDQIGVGVRLSQCGAGPLCDCGSGCSASGGTCDCSSCGTCNSCSTCVCCLPAPPAEWADAVTRSDLLWTVDDSKVDSSLKATIGNGYLAMQMDAATMFVAGIFNGPAAGSTPSHRAAISSPLNLRIDGSTAGPAALDMRGGRYLRRSVIQRTAGAAARTGASTTVEQRWYAHRSSSLKGLLVMELESLSGAVDVTLTGGLCPQPVRHFWDCWPFGGATHVTTSDIDFSVRRACVRLADNSTSDVTILSGRTKVSETSTTPRRDVSVVVSTPPAGSFTLNGTRLMIASFATSLESTDPEHDALSAYATAMPMRPAALYSQHAAEWDTLWEAGIELDGRPDAAAAINASLYYVLSSVRSDVVHSLSPGGLASNGYNGHTFWDTETWMWPPLLLLHPPIAQSLLEYRVQRVEFAKQKARSYSPPYDGAMFPWESAASGVETCPSWASTGQLEQHISGDIAFAAKQFHAVINDVEWLRSKGFPLVSAIADFWVSKAAQGTGADGVAHIRHVIPPDEYATGDDSVYTNAVAKIALDFATRAASLVGARPTAAWANTSSRVPMLYNATRGYHPEYAGYVYGTRIKQADVVLLSYPLEVNMSAATRDADLAAYEPATDANGPAMTWGMHAVGHLENDSPDKAARLFNRSFANVQAPFNVWTETPTGGTTNFLTGAGGFLQTALFGYPGLRIHDDSLRLRPNLIEGVRAMRLRGVHYRSHTLDVAYDQIELTLRLTRVGNALACAALCVTDERTADAHCMHAAGDSVHFGLHANASIFTLRCAASV